MVVINPEDVVRFCHEHNIIVLADEVYQDNIYGADRVFHSFRKVILSMPSPYNTTSCISLHSTSKGAVGECSRWGGKMGPVGRPPGALMSRTPRCWISYSLTASVTNASESCMKASPISIGPKKEPKASMHLQNGTQNFVEKNLS
ncbi:unnamed protein product [Bodo saltans]|uniref:Aminotransferase class I/classII large domain-containing protein n=1 Tax=Bodo saltans TaxID=75058 RepID=A0A0S4JGI7_BODSA|nr:unnamed protein product [Bodo saltans]|eukprot:CUG89064.1 unnamed protein product [Bodo saltans]